MKKPLTYILTTIIVALLIGRGAYWYQKNNPSQLSKESEQVEVNTNENVDSKQLETKKDDSEKDFDGYCDEVVMSAYESERVKFDLPENWGIALTTKYKSEGEIELTHKPECYPAVHGPSLSQITFIDNNDNHLDSFGNIIKTEELEFGKYIIKKKIRDVYNYKGSYWEKIKLQSECSIQYHIIEDKYVFCSNACLNCAHRNHLFEEENEKQIKYMVSSFEIKE